MINGDPDHSILPRRKVVNPFKDEDMEPNTRPYGKAREARRKKIEMFVFYAACLFVAGILAAVITIVIQRLDAKRDRVEATYIRFIDSQHCIRTGFVGKYPQAIYKCDNGTWLAEEISAYARNTTK